MTIRQRARRIIRDLNLTIHVAIHTGERIIAAIRGIWRREPHNRRPLRLVPAVAQAIQYHILWAVDGRESFAIDADTHGRLPSQLPPQLRRHRRQLADRRRRLVTMLLHALGDTADAVEASLTRHWQIAGDDDVAFGLIEDYLAARLRHRDPHALIFVDVFAWACCIGGTWVATPAAVRGYLRRAYAHEQMLRSMPARRPRRGVRMLPDRMRLGAIAAANSSPLPNA